MERFPGEVQELAITRRDEEIKSQDECFIGSLDNVIVQSLRVL